MVRLSTISERRTMLIRSTVLSACVFCGLLMTLAGCGGSDIPPLGTVTGSVTLNGQAVDEATVEFLPEEGGRPSIGVTDSSGTYSLTYRPSVKGAIVGRHSVRITTKRDQSGGEGDQPLVEARPEIIPQQYNDETTLKVEVKSGQNPHDFKLEGERGPERAPDGVPSGVPDA